MAMEKIDLGKLSALVSQKEGRKVAIEKIEPLASGYHSDGYKLVSRDKNYFLKKIKSHDLGFELPERRIASLLTGHNMAKRFGKKPLPLGVLVANAGNLEPLPEIGEKTKIYQIQELAEGTSYWSRLNAKMTKKSVDQTDIAELQKIVDFISDIHAIKYPSKDKERLKIIYRDGLRSVISHPELTLMFLSDFPDDHFLSIQRRGYYLNLMLKLTYRWQNRFERLSALHGDFWGGNIFFRPDGSLWAIDYSRIPWGDPGIDIGWWLSQYLWAYYESKNAYFRQLGEQFLKMYTKKTGDRQIRRAVSLTMGLMGIINTAPRFYPHRNKSVQSKFLKNIMAILKKGEFQWEN